VYLQADRRLDGCVFHPLELVRTDLTARMPTQALPGDA
ncbi:MAG: hypothetical protein JWM45_221, partial [Pseudonocardiales bacterium]|nr:hypothetical protein [Pseudonocardiales bacterium]